MSGIPLEEQQLTSTGIPIVIHKCLQFIESIGMDTEGLYRISGVKAHIRKLILAFNQGGSSSMSQNSGFSESIYVNTCVGTTIKVGPPLSQIIDSITACVTGVAPHSIETVLVIL